MSDHAEGSREDERNATRPAARVIDMLARGKRRLQQGTGEVVINFRNFWRRFQRDCEQIDGVCILPRPSPDEITEAEKKIRNILTAKDSEVSIDQIEEAITASKLCDCRNPIKTAFEVSTKLKELSRIRDESEAFLNGLAQQVEDFSVTLMQQINAKEERLIDHDAIDTYASLLDDITASAIRNEQKKFVSHPLTFRLMKRRWKFGLPPQLVPRKGLHFLLYIFVILETVLTPVLLPFIAYTFYKDQLLPKEIKEKLQKKTRRDMYLDYLTTPFVIFMKDKICQFVFIILHIRICVLDSSVEPRIEEYLILVFYIGFLMSELQQYLTSQSRVYSRNMWNYVDVITLSLHAVIFLLRVVSVIRGGDPYQNRLLEITYYVYGINTLLLILRFSSILEANKTVGPLQLALFRMCVDLFIILVQFGFVIVAFSVAITMVYTAEMSYVTPPPGQRQSNNVTNEGKGFCQSGTYACWYKASTHLIWSVFGLTDLEKMESQEQLSNTVVAVLYVIFLILSVIMLVNMLVALLTNTYDKVETNADVEWKFSRAVVAEEYRRCHPIIVPFNILSVPIAHLYIRRNGDMRDMRAKERRETYQSFYDQVLFPEITTRYKQKHGGSFPMSIEGKVDFLRKNFQEILTKLDRILESHGNQEDDTRPLHSGGISVDGISCHSEV